MTRIVWTGQAIDDLEAIRAFANQTFIEYGRITVARIVEAVERPPQFPLDGSPNLATGPDICAASQR